MKFIALKHKALRVILDPRVRHKEMGRTITESLTGATKLGLTVEFKDGMYETDDKVIIDALKGADGYGIGYVSDDKTPDVPNPEAAQKENEKKEYQEEVGSNCPYCGNNYKNAAAVNGHMKSCPKKNATS